MTTGWVTGRSNKFTAAGRNSRSRPGTLLGRALLNGPGGVAPSEDCHVTHADPMPLILVLGLMAVLPLFVVMTTSFMKIAVVLSLVRNAMGVQQIPPNLALYGLAGILTFYIMAPVGQHMYDTVKANPQATQSIESLGTTILQGAEPLRKFLVQHSKAQQRAFFMGTARKLWEPSMVAGLKDTDFVVLIPSFLVTELTSAFEMGFLIYLPFIVISS